MSMTGEALLAAARELVEASPAAETEVRITSVDERFVRFADGGPTQDADRSRLAVDMCLRVERRGDVAREARVTFGSLSHEAARSALQRALELAGRAPERELEPFGGTVSVPATAPVAATAAHPFEAKAEWIARAVEASRAAGLAPAGLAQTSSTTVALANSSGRAVAGGRGRASFALTATGPSGSGWADSIRADADEVAAESVVERAVDTALRAQNPGDWDVGPTTVVLLPAAVSSLLLFASYRGFGAREVDEKSSFLVDRIGQQVFSELVSIADDALNPLYPGLAFDAEGSPRSRVELVRSGVLGPPVTDRHWARRLGLSCSGHASTDPRTPKAQNLVLASGGDALEELVGGVERGLLVTQFHYTNMIEPRRLTLTGMTRNGTFRIENGRLGPPVRNLRFTESLVEALARVSGVGCQPDVAGALFDGEVVTPPLRIDGFHFTSTTDF